MDITSLRIKYPQFVLFIFIFISSYRYINIMRLACEFVFYQLVCYEVIWEICYRFIYKLEKFSMAQVKWSSFLIFDWLLFKLLL